ncbi:MAG: TonB family protein [Thermodesulfobacteriota bacterium]
MKTSPNLYIQQQLSYSPAMGKMFFVSLCLHVVAIGAMLFLPNLASQRTFYSPVYSVRLVSLPPSLPAIKEPAGAKSSPPSAPAKTREEIKIKEKEKPISLAPPKKEEEAQKKIEEAIAKIRQRKEEKSLETAIERLRRQKEEKNVEEAIERIRSSKEAEQINSAIEGIRHRVTIGSSGATESNVGASAASAGVMSIKHKLYYNLIWQRIRSVWVLPEEALRGKKNLETIIAIRIAKDGQIEEIYFEKRSGNPHLDESCWRAIKKANPLPPLPPGMEGDKLDLGVRFSPAEL